MISPIIFYRDYTDFRNDFTDYFKKALPISANLQKNDSLSYVESAKINAIINNQRLKIGVIIPQSVKS